jgi:DNA-binding transcriptional LysR family regulator
MARPRGAALLARAVARIPYAAFCTDGYRRAHRGPHAYLALDGAMARTPEARWTARALGGRAPELRASSLAALAAAAAAGLGVAILPTPLAALHGALRRLAPAAPPVGERILYAVVPAALRRDPRLRAALACPTTRWRCAPRPIADPRPRYPRRHARPARLRLLRDRLQPRAAPGPNAATNRDAAPDHAVATGPDASPAC